jgi:hypothetical protein
VLPESSTTISSTQDTDERQRSMFASSFLVIIIAEMRIQKPVIARMTLLRSVLNLKRFTKSSSLSQLDCMQTPR